MVNQSEAERKFTKVRILCNEQGCFRICPRQDGFIGHTRLHFGDCDDLMTGFPQTGNDRSIHVLVSQQFHAA